MKILPEPTAFEWDEGNMKHIKRHEVTIRECEDSFINTPFLITEDQTHSQNEQRYRGYGKTNSERLLLIIFTLRKEKVRVVSARDQSKRERNEFKKVGGELL